MKAILHQLIKSQKEGKPDLKLLSSLRKEAKNSIPETVSHLVQALEKPHSQVRYLILEILRDFFPRSHLFRCELLKKSKLLVRLIIGDENWKLPGPPKWDRELRELAKNTLKEWHEKFKSHNELDGIQMMISAIPVVDEQHETEDLQQKRSNAIRMSKYQKMFEQDIPQLSNKLEEYLQKLENTITLLIPKIEQSNDVQLMDVGTALPKSYSLSIQLKSQTLRETKENEVIYDTLRENLDIITKLKSQLTEFISLTTKVDDNDTERRLSRLKKLLDFKARIDDGLAKGNEILDITAVDESDDEEFEEIGEDYVPKLPIIPAEASRNSKPMELIKAPYTPGTKPVFKSSISATGKDEPKSPELDNEELPDLFKLAPVVEFDTDLQFWSVEHPTIDQISSHPGLEVNHRFLGTADSNSKLSDIAVSRLRKRIVYVNDNQIPAEYEKCSAPLPNGGLCQRRDMKNCPYHGPKVKRDKYGKRLDGLADNFKKRKAAWEVIEGEVSQTIGESSRTRRNGLDIIEKEKKTVREKIVSKVKTLAKNNRNERDFNAEYRERDLNAFRW